MGKAVFKQKNGLFAVAFACNCGVMTPEQLTKLNTLVQEFEVKALKMTTRQTMLLVVEEDQVPELEKRIEQIGFIRGTFKNTIRNVKGCSGSNDLCPRAVGDALGLGIEIQTRYFGQAVPHDFKIATAGCSRGCTDPRCADFGVFCNGNNTFDVFIGGKGGGRKPAHAECLTKKVNKDNLFIILDYVLSQYRQLAIGKERINKTIERVGLDKFMPPDLKPEPVQEIEIDQAFIQMLGGQENRNN
jgi:NAD(P)H-nitrite reductase large subunit